MGFGGAGLPGGFAAGGAAAAGGFFGGGLDRSSDPESSSPHPRAKATTSNAAYRAGRGTVPTISQAADRKAT
jgi:hypothetical protein